MYKNFLSKLIFISFVLISIALLASCNADKPTNNGTLSGNNWAEKLGFPHGKKVLILHADDIGLCDEATTSAISYLEMGEIQSAAIMVPCPSADEAILWAANNQKFDVGLHLTLTSEWKTYRWGTISDPIKVGGLLDNEGKMHREVKAVVQNATPEEVELEIRAQIEKAISMGMKPDHIDTHMGTLYGSSDFLEVFLKVAEQYNIPANAIDLSDEFVAEHFRDAGYPIDEEVIAKINNYKLPKLDFFASVPKGKTYSEKRTNFFNLVKKLPVGLTEIIFHPSIETENLKGITNSWQQRVWEAQLFSDPLVKQFFIDEGIIFTNWQEIMSKYNSLVKN